MLVRLTLVLTAEAVGHTAAADAVGLVEKEHKKDTKSSSRHPYA